MNWWLIAFFVLLAVAALFGFGWITGQNWRRDRTMDALAKEKQQKVRADAKANEAEIHSRPALSKPALIDLMRDKL